MGSWGILFTLISIFYAIKAIQTGYILLRRWHPFWSDRMAPEDLQLAKEIGFFYIVPISILFHEIGHALATWMVGGQVAEFRWFIYWGYVRPVGMFSPAEDWWIALSGNLVSLLCGLFLLGWGYKGRMRRRILRFMLLETGYFLTMYTLIGYPLLSLLGLVGDWVIIYDVHRTPLLSALTGIGHLALVVSIWRWWNSPDVVRRRFLLLRREEETAAPEADARVEDFLRQARVYLRENHPELAIPLLRQALTRWGDDSRLMVILGESWLRANRPHKAIPWFQRALDGGELDAANAQTTRELLAMALLLEDRAKEAARIFEKVETGPPSSVHILYWAGLAYMKTGQNARALTRFREFLEQAKGMPELTEMIQYAKAFVEELASSQDV